MNRSFSPRSLRFAAPAAVALLALAGMGQTARAQTIVNAGFEIPSLGNGFQYTPSGAGVGWTFTGGAGISGNNSGFTSGNPVAPEGTQVAFLQNTSSFSQTISGFTAGLYTVSFQAAQRGAGGATQPSVQDFSVALDGLSVSTFKPTTTTYATFTTKGSLLTAGSHTLTFTGLNTANAADVTAFVDNVRFNAVGAPEPGSLALLAIGAAPLAGLAVRRKRR